MNTKQEIADVFDGEPGDGCPPPAVFTQTGTVGQMDACGTHWPEASFDVDAMVGLSRQFSRMFGFATARVPYCLTVEASVLGGEVYEGRIDSQPSISGSPNTSDGLSVPPVPGDLPDPDEFATSGRCAMVAEAVGRISRENPDLFVTAGILDPTGLACQLLGTEASIMGYLMEPDQVVAWCRAMEPYSRAYARRLSEDADNITVIASASLDIFTPEMYHDMVHDPLKGLISDIRCSSTIHSCGQTMSLIDDLVSLGADGLSLEASGDPQGFLDAVGGRCLMFGSVNPVRTLLTGSPVDVRSEARRYAELGFDIVTPECGVPPRTPDDNLRALADYRL